MILDSGVDGDVVAQWRVRPTIQVLGVGCDANAEGWIRLAPLLLGRGRPVRRLLGCRLATAPLPQAVLTRTGVIAAHWALRKMYKRR